MQISVQYFAILREQRGVSSEELEVSPMNVADLYLSLDLAVAPSIIRYAVNSEFVSGEYMLKEGDSVVFIPPVAGG